MKLRLMKRLKESKENQKGFTLVELIVVIVILGVLAAITIPSFIGYINKADASEVQVEAHSLYLAASTLWAESRYQSVPTDEEIFALAGVASSDAGELSIDYASSADETGQILELRYTKNGITATVPTSSTSETTAATQ